jgi:threonine dehydrogenase-like Zn-dependent dehydrogenase
MPRALVLEGPRRLRLVEQPSDPLKPGEARLRSLLSGISHGTELSLYRGTSASPTGCSTAACARSSGPRRGPRRRIR